MRIVIAGPPKTGNMWLKCLLGRAYGLRWLRPHETPERPDADALAAWLAGGRYPADSIFHQHYDYSPRIVELLAPTQAKLVTIVRDPYDAFVSTYYTMQLHAESQNAKGRRFTELMGKALDDPDVVDFLRQGGYRNNLEKARDWALSGDAVVLRYEDLIRDSLGTLQAATAQIGPVGDDRLQVAIEYCTADRMRERSKGGRTHVRAATVGDSRKKLNEAHFAAFRDAYGDIITELG
ncbi:MAG: sulfotransferase domain-containing protein, partial [Thermomicrobiales bacterium]|nr:sulfotransferase domain-containing protein [Thermomicrobiales bacterium]